MNCTPPPPSYYPGCCWSQRDHTDWSSVRDIDMEAGCCRSIITLRTVDPTDPEISIKVRRCVHSLLCSVVVSP
jgi:hypothetical protein